jgi:aminoglycoside/choline kinase family phosphotransferase
VDALYEDAIQALCAIQSRGDAHAALLPPYDRELLDREMQLLPDWLCERHLRLALSSEERALFAETFDTLRRNAFSQPQVFVHRDYHSRNLMVLPRGNPGILDFQDAVRGPVTYDLVGLFRDVYVAWPYERVRAWVLRHRAIASAAGVDVGPSDADFLRWFDLMGAQRHIKILGLFARLFYRDGKPRYLQDLPLTLDYVRSVCGRYEEMAELGRFLDRRVVPVLAQRTAEALA